MNQAEAHALTFAQLGISYAKFTLDQISDFSAYWLIWSHAPDPQLQSLRSDLYPVL